MERNNSIRSKSQTANSMKAKISLIRKTLKKMEDKGIEINEVNFDEMRLKVSRVTPKFETCIAVEEFLSELPFEDSVKEEYRSFYLIRRSEKLYNKRLINRYKQVHDEIETQGLEFNGENYDKKKGNYPSFERVRELLPELKNYSFLQ